MLYLKKKNHYIYISAIDIDSVLKIDKRAYPQAYLEQCKYKLKKRKPVNFIDLEIIDESDDDSDYNNDDGYYGRIVNFIFKMILSYY